MLLNFKTLSLFFSLKVWVGNDPGSTKRGKNDEMPVKKYGSETTHEVQKGGEISKYGEG